LRLFIAVNVPADVRSRLYADMAALRASAHGVTWVKQEHLHITMKFLGERPDNEMHAIEAALQDATTRFSAFPLRLGGIGAFPSLDRPRVVWLGAVGTTPLPALFGHIDATCGRLGIPREERRFTTHLTLGRVKRELSAGDRSALTAEARRLEATYDVPVQSVDLMLSELSRTGPSYTVLARALLGEPQGGR
jgi:RNA 2',3'-cyclic 3'-phosphodiesterase